MSGLRVSHTVIESEPDRPDHNRIRALPVLPRGLPAHIAGSEGDETEVADRAFVTNPLLRLDSGAPCT